MRTGLVAVGVTALGLMSTTGLAEPRPASLRVDCPALDEETRAAVEARAQAELASARLPEGEVAVVCGTASATITWSPRDGTRRESRVEFVADGAVDDLILAALYQLLFVEPPPAAATTPGVDVRTPTPTASTSSTIVPRTPLPRRIRVAGLAGADAELWHGDIDAALGAYAGMVVSPWDRWRLSLAIGPQWGVGRAAGVEAWGLRVFARAEYEVLPRLPIGIGVSGRSLWTSRAASAPSQRDGMTAGVVVTARYVLQLGWVEVSVGPRVEALVRPIVIDVAGNEIFRVPSCVAAIGIEAAAPALRRLNDPKP